MKRDVVRIVAMAAAMVTIGLTIMVVVACTAMSPPQREALLRQSAELQETSTVERERQAAERDRQQRLADEARIAGNQEAVRVAEAARDKAAKAVALLDKVIPMIAQGHSVFETSVGPDGTININPAAVAVGTAVGGPIGTGIAIGLPLLWGILAQLSRNKKANEALENLNAAKSIVAGIDKVSVEDPTLSRQLDEKWASVESKMTPKAIEIVNEHSVT